MRSTRGELVLVIAALLAMGGCSSVRPYRLDHPENLTFSSPGLKGSFFSSAKVSLHIFFAADACDKAYQGSITLEAGDGPQRIGLPTGRDVYARVWFQSYNWLENGTKTRSHEFRFRPRRGYQYAIEYTHRKKAYGEKLIETNTRTGRTAEMRVEPWPTCDV